MILIFAFTVAAAICSSNGQVICDINYDDPCDTDLQLTDWQRSVQNEVAPGSHYLSDYYLPFGWYRLKNEGDRTNITMAKYSPGKYHCGAKYPMWVRDEYPEISDSIKNVVVCVDNGKDTCKYSQIMCIKACNSTEGIYYVHFLFSSVGSSMAYCTDTRLPCQNGTYSATGYTPCNNYYPILDEKPTLEFGVKPTGISAECTYQTGKYDFGELDFLVKWYINNDFVYEKIYQSDESGLNAFISDECDCGINCEPYQCVLNSQLNSQIQCEVRARFRDTDHTAFPPGVKSNTIFAGLVTYPNSTVYVISEADNGQEFIFNATFPIVLREENSGEIPCITIDVSSNGKTGVLANKGCSKSIRNGSPATFKILAERDNINDGDEQAYIQFKGDVITFDEASRIWEGHADNLPAVEVKVIVKDVPSATTCTSIGDPHIKTFDGLYYYTFAAGDYILYKHNSLPIQIQVRFAPCGIWSSETCNCGIAVKIGSTYLIIDRCGTEKKNHYQTFTVGENDQVKQNVEKIRNIRIITAEFYGEASPKTDIQYKNEKYVIEIPTGNKISVSLMGDTFINVQIDASSEDYKDVEGLCGNFDGNVENDGEYNCINSTCESNVEYGTEADDSFINMWRVKDEENIFLGNLTSDPYDFSRYCSCIKKEIKCNSCNGRIDSETYDECTDNHERKKRAVDDDYDLDDLMDDYKFGPLEIDPNFKKLGSPKFPTESGLTEESTRKLCTETLMNSTTYGLCLNTINNGSVKIDDIIIGCVIDIKNTDDISFAKETVTTLQFRCEVVLSKNVFYWEPAENGTMVPPTDLIQQMCPNECNGVGKCINGSCVCNEGLGGGDCSISLVQPPLVYAVLGDGICDVRKRPCKSAKVYGGNFVLEKNLTCHIKFIDVSENDFVVLSENKISHGKYKTPEVVKCPLLEHRIKRDAPGEGIVSSGYLISVSNDGELASESMAIMILYDSVCQVCNATEGKCNFKENSCKINGHCYSAFETNPQNVCQYCSPEHSVDTWTNKEDGGGNQLDACVNECKGEGMCINGSCICRKKPPSVFAILGDDTCDFRNRLCNTVRIYGRNFLNSKTLTCHIKLIDVSKTNYVISKHLTIPGMYESAEEVECNLPEPVVQPDSSGEGIVSSGYLISVSNDGELVSESMAIMIIYDSVCQACNASAGKCALKVCNATAGTCTLKENSCKINGHCYSASEVNPQNVCQQCSPTRTAESWTNLDDADCKERKVGIPLIMVFVFCSMVSIIFIILLIFFWKRGRKDSGRVISTPQSYVYSELAKN